MTECILGPYHIGNNDKNLALPPKKGVLDYSFVLVINTTK